MADELESPQTEAVNVPPVEPPVIDDAPNPEGAAPKKRRGRPPGSGKKSPEAIELGSANAGGTSGAAKPGKRKASGMTQDQLLMMGKQLVGVHQIAAMTTGIPELVISNEEGYALAQGISNVCEQYDLSVDGKTGAALQLLFTAAMIYGPRALHVKKRAEDAQRAEAARTVPQNDAGQSTAH